MSKVDAYHVFERGILRVDERGEIVGLQEEEEVRTREEAQKGRHGVRLGTSSRRTVGQEREKDFL